MVLLDAIEHQPTVIAALRSAHRRGRLAHAYLFWGPEGVGKLRSAQALAQLLLCSAASAAVPCGVCIHCQRVLRFTHPDLHVVLPLRRAAAEDPQKALEEYAADPYHCIEMAPGASIGIDRVRGLKVESSKARVETGNRVIVLRYAEQLTLEAAQAALKLIEEPRADTYLVLTCRDSSHLLPTIVSRCQRLRFRPLPRDYLERVLAHSLGVAPARARMIAGLARGSLSRAVQMCGADVIELRRGALELFERPLPDAAAVVAHVRGVERVWNAQAARATVDLLMTWYADTLAAGAGLAGAALTNADQQETLVRRAGELSIAEIKRRLAIIEELAEAIERNVNPTLALQSALLRLNRLGDGEGSVWA